MVSKHPAGCRGDIQRRLVQKSVQSQTERRIA
jgi:hypothetical protein